MTGIAASLLVPLIVAVGLATVAVDRREVHVVLNWFEELEGRVPGGN